MKSLFFDNIYGFWLNQIEIGNRWVGQRGLKGLGNQHGVTYGVYRYGTIWGLGKYVW